MRKDVRFVVTGLLSLLQFAGVVAVAQGLDLLGVGSGPDGSVGTAPAADSGAGSLVHPLTGKRAQRPNDWVGTRPLPPNVPILVMAGHADSQNIEGAAGTPGFLGQKDPMDPSMRDELYWNLAVAREVVRLGKQRGLNIEFYDPPERTILWENDPRTTWSKGRDHALKGGYALEIHFDAYGPDGYGSGLIPSIQVDLREPPAEGADKLPEPEDGEFRPMPPSVIDEHLAREFGRFEAKFQNGLGGPMRGFSLLEVGKLEGTLEEALRNRPVETVNAIATRIVHAMCRALGKR